MTKVMIVGVSVSINRQCEENKWKLPHSVGIAPLDGTVTVRYAVKDTENPFLNHWTVTSSVIPITEEMEDTFSSWLLESICGGDTYDKLKGVAFMGTDDEDDDQDTGQS